jgi:hypothetical protein
VLRQAQALCDVWHGSGMAECLSMYVDSWLATLAAASELHVLGGQSRLERRWKISIHLIIITEVF